MRITEMDRVTKVVPHAGTWIEIARYFTRSLAFSVVPHAGTWIEIMQLKL